MNICLESGLPYLLPGGSEEGNGSKGEEVGAREKGRNGLSPCATSYEHDFSVHLEEPQKSLGCSHLTQSAPSKQSSSPGRSREEAGLPPESPQGGPWQWGVPSEGQHSHSARKAPLAISVTRKAARRRPQLPREENRCFGLPLALDRTQKKSNTPAPR